MNDETTEMRQPVRSAIVKADRLDALTAAQSGIERAQAEAQSILEAAQRDADAIREQATMEGRENVARMLSGAAREIEDDLAGIEDRIVDLVMTTVRSVIAPYDDAERVTLAANRALADFDRNRPVSLIVAPEVADEVRRYVDGLSLGERVEVRGTPGTDISSSVLETPWGMIELSIEAQLEALERSMRGVTGPGA